MKFREIGMGLFGWSDQDVGIWGGMRDNRLHPAGHLWCNFAVFDSAHKRKTGEDLQFAKMTLLIKFPETEDGTPSIVKLLNFEVDKSLRRSPRLGREGQGYGRRAIEGLQRAADQDIEICDIKPVARGFWKKVGVIESGTRARKDAMLPAAKPEYEETLSAAPGL